MTSPGREEGREIPHVRRPTRSQESNAEERDRPAAFGMTVEERECWSQFSGALGGD